MAYTISGTASSGGTGVANISVLFRNITQDYFYHNTSVTDSSGDYSFDVDGGGDTVANDDTFWVIFYGVDYYKVETGTIDTGAGASTVDASLSGVGVDKDTVSTDVWDFLRVILTQDDYVDAATTYVGGSYPKVFITDEGGLPFVIIRKPTIVEESLTLRKKRYNITVPIEIKTNTAASLKDVSEKVRKAIKVAKPAFITNKFAHLQFTDDDESVDKRRDEKTVHTSTLTLEMIWLGGGKSSFRDW